MNNFLFFNKNYKKIFTVIVLFLFFHFSAKGIENGKNFSAPVKTWYSDIFVSGSLQTFIAVPVKKDFALPKPGYSLSAGYTFFHEKKHSMPLYLETGHRVISGTNPLVRTLDIFPLTINLSYEYSPIEYFSIGAIAGTGIYFSQIQRYPVVMDILTNKLKKTNVSAGVLNLGLSLGGNLISKNIEFRASFSCDLLLEKKRAIPFPSFQLGVRMYPLGIYSYAKKKKEPEVIIKEIKVPSEPVVLPPKAEPELPQFDSIYIYFEPESFALDVNAKAEIKKAASILNENSDIFVLFEGSTAPFGTEGGRIKFENARILTVAEYLQKNCGIVPEKIIYTEPFKNRDAKKEGAAKEEYYTQFRYVQLKFVRLQFNTEDGKNVYKTQGEKE